MAYNFGFEIKNSKGELQVSSKYKTFHLFNKTHVDILSQFSRISERSNHDHVAPKKFQIINSCQKSIRIRVFSTDNLVFSDGPYGCRSMKYIETDGIIYLCLDLIISEPINIFVFSSAEHLPGAGYGMEVFDENSLKTYASQYPVMRGIKHIQNETLFPSNIGSSTSAVTSEGGLVRVVVTPSAAKVITYNRSWKTSCYLIGSKSHIKYRNYTSIAYGSIRNNGSTSYKTIASGISSYHKDGSCGVSLLGIAAGFLIGALTGGVGVGVAAAIVGGSIETFLNNASSASTIPNFTHSDTSVNGIIFLDYIDTYKNFINYEFV